MWISLAVPLAVLLAAVLLQRLEASLLSTPKADEHPGDEHPGGEHLTDADVPPLTLVHPPPRPRRSPHAPTARATA